MMSRNPYRKYGGEAEVKTDGKVLEMENVTYQLNGIVKTGIDNGRGFTSKAKG